MAYTSGDPVALAKALSTWVKDNAEFTFKLGIVDGKVINVDEIDALAKLPGKEELFSKLLFLIKSPAQRLATVINATGRNLAVVVNQARGAGQVRWRGAAAPAAQAPKRGCREQLPQADGCRGRCSRSPRTSRQIGAPASSRRGAAQPENGTARRLAKLLRPSRSRDNKFRSQSSRGCAVWAQRKPGEDVATWQPKRKSSLRRRKSAATELQ